MSTATKPLRSPAANGGFGDPDLTPEPLRISKREHAGTSTASTVNSSLSICKSQTQLNLQALAPSKTFSNQVNSTQLDLSRQDLAAPTSQWARRNTFLHVHKQRHSEPINTNTAAFAVTFEEPIGFSPFNPPARSRESCPAMDQLGGSPDASKAITVHRPAPIRAITTGNHNRTNPLSPVHEVSSPPVLRSGRRRAATDVEAYYKDPDSLKPVPFQKSRNRPSAKNGLMSRMMSGLTSRTQISHAASRSETDASQTFHNFWPAYPSRSPEDMHPLRQSNSSSGIDMYNRSNVHNVLRSFPTPPTSKPTSSTTVGSLDSRHSSGPQRVRELCKPADAIMMGAELTLTPQFDQLRCEKEQSLLVSLDIKGTTNSTFSVQDVWSQHTGLDIVVVIDNSLHTSPAALMASCETARFLASILNRVTDRLAILCTSITDTSVARSTVRDLYEVRMDEIKTDLDAIAGSTAKLNANTWINTIHCAKDILLKSAVPDPDEELLQDTFGHIFILTPDADELPLQSLTHDHIPFHVICPAIIPSNDQASIHCNGWKLRSLSGMDTQVVSKRKDLDPMSVTNRLRALIAQVRSGKTIGNLTDLDLEVSAGPDCTIEGVVGKFKFAELHPGEVFTALFRLRIRDAATQEHSSCRSPTQSSEASHVGKRVLSQLGQMLGTTDARILTARLIYKHSLLPAGTTCTVSTECHIKKRLANADQQLNPLNLHLFRTDDCTVLVEKRLAYHLATQGSPRNALKTLHDQFGDNFQYSTCQDYINLLVKELKYQARILERLEIAVSPRKKPPVVHATHSQCSLRTEYHKPLHRATTDSPTQKPPPLHTAHSQCSIRTEYHKPLHRAVSDFPTKVSPTVHTTTSQISLRGEYHKLLHCATSSTSSKNSPTVPTTTSQSPLRTENQNPLHRKTSDIPTEELFKTEPALAVRSVRKSREGLRTDEARRIWSDLRNMKRPKDQVGNGNGKGRSMSSKLEEARREGIREVALRNERSVGDESVRSLVFEGVGKGFGAPWM